MKKAVVLMGSPSDKAFSDLIVQAVASAGIAVETHVASAHKQPREVLRIIESYAAPDAVVFITVAGRSNALSGMVVANTAFPVIACPPFVDKTDMLVNIHSSLQMPSNVPVMTVLDPLNAAQAALRMLALAGDR